MTLPLNSFVGEYRLADFVGAGGMGEVYRVVHPKLGRMVAVKVVAHVSADSGFVERFLNEARIQAELQHPNIVTLYGFIERAGRPCIVMEGHDHRFGHDKRTTPMPSLNKSNIQQIVDLLTPLMERENERRSLLILALGQDAPILRRLDPTGPVESFLVNMIKVLVDYGEVAPGKQALWALLEEVKERVGVDRQAKISALYPVINALGRNDDQGRLRKDPGDRYPSARALLNDLDRASASISTPRLHDAPHGSTSPGAGIFSALRPYLPAGLVLLVIVAMMAMGLWWAAQSPSSRSTPRKGEDTAAVRLNDGRELRPVHIGVIGEPAQLYIRLDQGPWEGPHPTPYQFSAPLGKRITWKLSRKGYQDKTGSFNVQVVNEYYPRLCPVGTECPND